MEAMQSGRPGIMLMWLDTDQARTLGIRGPAEACAPQIALQI